jgi:hypothetical protein
VNTEIQNTVSELRATLRASIERIEQQQAALARPGVLIGERFVVRIAQGFYVGARQADGRVAVIGVEHALRMNERIARAAARTLIDGEGNKTQGEVLLVDDALAQDRDDALALLANLDKRFLA